MRFSQLHLLVASSSLAMARPTTDDTTSSSDSWSTAGPDDVRGPCPMLNSLANHGILPHSGKNITSDVLVSALGSALNVEESLALYLFNQALATNPETNATTFSLSDLSTHNILEHDASLSRGDFYFGDNHSFNETIFNETKSYWTGDTIDVQMTANARSARIATSKVTNPEFNLTTALAQGSLSESAAFICTLGNKSSGAVPKSFVEYLFENERLPTELGWTKSDESIALSDFQAIMVKIAAV